MFDFLLQIDSILSDLIADSITSITQDLQAAITEDLQSFIDSADLDVSEDIEDVDAFLTDINNQISELSDDIPALTTKLIEFDNLTRSIAQFDFSSIEDILDDIISQAESTLGDVFSDVQTVSFNDLETFFGDVFSDVASFQEVQTIVDSIYAQSPDAQIVNLFGIINGPIEQLMKIPGVYWDPRTENLAKKVTDDLVSTYFENAQEAYSTIIDDMKGFRDVGSGLNLGSLLERPLMNNFLHPSEPTVNRVARGDPSVFQAGGMRYNSEMTKDPLIGEPAIDYQAVFPYNKYSETESGHIYETDDTPGHERLQIRHRTGTGFNVNPDGSQSILVKGSNYQVIVMDNKMHVSGNIVIFGDNDANVSLNGMCQVTVAGDCNLSIGGSGSINAKHNLHFRAGGDIKLDATGNLELKCGDNGDASRRTKPQTDTDDTDKLYGNLRLIAQQTLFLSGDSSVIESAKSSIVSAGESIGMYSQKGALFQAKEDVQIQGGNTVQVASRNTLTLSGSLIQQNSLPVQLADDPEPVEVLRFVTAPKIRQPHPSNANRHHTSLMTDYEGFSEGEKPVTFSTMKVELEKGAVSQGDLLRSPNVMVPTAIDQTQRSPGSASNMSTGIVIPSNFNPSDKGHPFYKTKLSNHIYLRDVTINPVLSSCSTPLQTNGYASQREMLDNLEHLAKSALDILHEQFGGFSFGSFGRSPGKITLNCALRNSGAQWHRKGQAVDIQNASWGKMGYYQKAIEIADALSGRFDHILLEYQTTGSRNPWIHICMRTDSARGLTKTMMNHSTVANKFVNLGNK